MIRIIKLAHAKQISAGLKNFRNFYAPLVDAWALYDNSGDDAILLDWSDNE